LIAPWVEEAFKKGTFSSNAIALTRGWLQEGLQPRAMTRDLKWGVPVPLKGWEDKVFYVWVSCEYRSLMDGRADG
jgi:methionyl-tRNA synthetase